MATADVSIDVDFELEEYAREQRDRISLCFSEARRRLNEREAKLSLQFEEKLNECRAHNKSITADKNQLKYALELLLASLSSNSLQETGDESARPIKEKIVNLENQETIVQFDWFPQNLYTEISNIGSVTILPNQITCILEYNTKKQMFFKRVSPPYHEQQNNEIHSLLSKELQKGQYWYLIHIRWYKQWKHYVGYDKWDKSSAGMEEVKPGPIDNTSLLDQDKLRRHQEDEIDYKLVPKEAWYKLLSWYGISEGSMSIRRQVVEVGKFVKQCKIEVYPLELKSCLYPKESDFIITTISRCDTIHTLENKIRELFNIDTGKQTRIYNRYMTYHYELIKDLSLEAQDIGLFDRQCVLIEVQNFDGTWPRTIAANKKIYQ
ncbi:Ubiquitin carboxyl-terminal hydrolase 4 isoform X5 [Oopsacas minuta]|uniref:Ubiquitin carboxyl-terminal hydrolase 4 isoform X5 n=1 Tax=Oopsacas minuta TaxID=111878 RepID=A0AAV7KIN8_9METZ|nr:Ubiquitin carboxyl-terminal hydrolase 4 isoform X5 [Oopsacas minuta]